MSKNKNRNKQRHVQRAHVVVAGPSSGSVARIAKLLIDNCSNESGRSEPRKIGILCVGGGGIGVALSLFKKFPVLKHLNIFFCLLDADLSTLTNRVVDSTDEAVKGWLASGRVRIHQLGGKEVTNGTGTGGDPEEGKKAAETEKSKAYIIKFFKEIGDDYLAIGTSGGGCSSGALPVIAEYAKKETKTCLGIVMMPDIGDRRGHVSTPMLKKMKDIGATLTIENTYLPEWLKLAHPEKRSVMHEQEAWETINDLVVATIIELLVRFMSSKADTESLDRADWKMAITFARNVLVGLYEMAKTKKDESETAATKQNVDADSKVVAEAIAKKLMAGYFQDRDALKDAAEVLMWFDGHWPLLMKTQIREAIIAEIKKLNTSTQVEFHSASNIGGQNDPWRVSVVFADRQPNAPALQRAQVTPASAEQPVGPNELSLGSVNGNGNGKHLAPLNDEAIAPPPAQQQLTSGPQTIDATPSTTKAKEAASRVVVSGAGPGLKKISYPHNKKDEEHLVAAPFADRFNDVYWSENSTYKQVTLICDEVVSQGFNRPDYPSRFQVTSSDLGDMDIPSFINKAGGKEVVSQTEEVAASQKSGFSFRGLFGAGRETVPKNDHIKTPASFQQFANKSQ